MRDHIVETAGRLFYQHGVKTVGVDRIIAEAGIAKATLYRHFPSKEQLVVAYLHARHDAVMQSMEQGRLGAQAGACARVLRYFEILQRKADSPEFKGCAFLLALAEHEDSAPIKEVVLRHKQAILETFLAELPEDLAGRLPLARQLALLYDGALAQIMVQRSPEAAQIAALCADSLLQAQLGR